MEIPGLPAAQLRVKYSYPVSVTIAPANNVSANRLRVAPSASQHELAALGVARSRRRPPALRELGPTAPVVSLNLIDGRFELRLILGMRNPQPLSKGAQPDGDFVEVLEARDRGQRVRQWRPHLGGPRGLRSIHCDCPFDATRDLVRVYSPELKRQGGLSSTGSRFALTRVICPHHKLAISRKP